jgi:hypothetical protein
MDKRYLKNAWEVRKQVVLGNAVLIDLADGYAELKFTKDRKIHINFFVNGEQEPETYLEPIEKLDDAIRTLAEEGQFYIEEESTEDADGGKGQP